MCGICGVLNSNNEPVSSGLIKKMTRAIRHRGPDDEGIWIEGSIGLGMRRLSIIDLQTGKQPIFNEDKSIVVITNGEIYNYKSLKKSLQNNGHKFYTNTDVEVIVHLYEKYGKGFVERIDGMFSIALWDKNNKKLILVRDRFGIKPLYYLDDGSKRLLFASEIKSIIQDSRVKREINLKGLHYYLTYGYIPAPYTIFEGIFKLLPGQLLTVNHSGEKKLEYYWNISPQLSTKTSNKKDNYLSNFEGIFTQVVKSHLMSDVPIGVFLSGGIDSSILVAIMNLLGESKVKTFSIGFDDSHNNELPFARIVAKKFGTVHHEEVISPSAMEILPDLVWHFDEPFADSSAIPMYYLTKMASSHVKVALSGDGGDELFGGYDRHRRIHFVSIYRLLPKSIRKNLLDKLLSSTSKKRWKRKFNIFSEGSLYDNAHCYKRWVNIFSDDIKNELYTQYYKDLFQNIDVVNIMSNYQSGDFKSSMDEFFYMDLKSYLPDDLLMKADKTSMAHSLEVRVPFLDHKFVEWAVSIPNKYKVRGLTTKYLLREYLKKYLPPEITNRPKQGFSVPIDSWFKGSMFNVAADILLSNSFNNRGYFKRQTIEKMLYDQRNNQGVYSKEIWSLMFFEIWCQKFVDKVN